MREKTHTHTRTRMCPPEYVHFCSLGEMMPRRHHVTRCVRQRASTTVAQIQYQYMGVEYF